jgi:hypothetical protein
MNERTRIKICGLTREADVDAAVESGADAVGFVLYDKSPRHVGIERAAQLAARLPAFVMPVGLFVNAVDAQVQAALRAIPQLPASMVGLLLLLQPALSFVFDVVLFARPTSGLDRVGLGLSLLGIFIGTWRREAAAEPSAEGVDEPARVHPACSPRRE